MNNTKHLTAIFIAGFITAIGGAIYAFAGILFIGETPFHAVFHALAGAAVGIFATPVIEWSNHRRNLLETRAAMQSENLQAFINGEIPLTELTAENRPQ